VTDVTSTEGPSLRGPESETLPSDKLADAFAYLLGLRLSARLERLRLHQTPDNLVNTAEISKLERDLLKDSLQIVKRFKEVVRHHFRLGMF